MRLLVVIALLAISRGSFAQTFMWAAVEGNRIEPGGFSFPLAHRQCSVTKAGRGECRDRGIVTWSFRVPVDDGRIENLAVAQVGEDLVLAYELTDEEGVWGKLVRVSKSRLKWQRHIGGLNLALPLGTGGDAFVAALAYIARVNLRNGSFMWRLERTYSGGGYESSELSLSGTQLVVSWRDGTTGKLKIECLAARTGHSEICLQK